MSVIEERILAIDYGLKRIGLALSDPLKIFAYPYKTLSNDRNFFPELKKILDENKVVMILLGYPVKESGERSTMTDEVDIFNTELKKSFRGEIILRDERYTSGMAMQNIIESVNKKMKRRDKGLVDRNAAAIILQEYLDEISKPPGV